MHLVISRRRILAILAAVVLGGSILVVATGTVFGIDPRLAKCGGTHHPVRAAFALVHASDFAAHFPRAGDMPELAANPAPAFVVVFDGPVVLPYVGFDTGGPPREIVPDNNVVCVFVDNDQTWYTNVNLTGLQP
jgi:hypothetical protein